MEHGVLLRVGLVADDGAAQAHIVEALASFDLDDLGAHVGQDHAGDGAGQHPAEIQHPIAGQGSVALPLLPFIVVSDIRIALPEGQSRFRSGAIQADGRHHGQAIAAAILVYSGWYTRLTVQRMAKTMAPR